EETMFVSDEDIAVVCCCNVLAVREALRVQNIKIVHPDAKLCRMRLTGKPHEANFNDFTVPQPLWKWTRLAELKQIVDEYIRTRPASS
ncbi:MAG TPA: hypothetical protein VN516_01705, partial [Candidatus Baltobacteraceae bacterium]|nr:hypothetical protein [Candidatus Baltobacteraceae bacterium]